MKFEQEVTSLHYLRIVDFKKFTFLSFRSQIEDFNSSMFLSFRWAMFYYVFFLSANYFKFCLSFADLLWLPLPFPIEPLTTQKYLCFFEVFCFCFVCFLISYSYWHFWIDSERTHWQCVDFPGLLKCQFQVKQTFISFQKHHGKKVEKLKEKKNFVLRLQTQL